MKRKILILNLILIVTFSFGQNLVQENKLWSNTMIGSEIGSNYDSYYIKFEGDNIINGQNYKGVFKSDTEDHNNWNLYAYIREDTIEQKIYLYKSFFEKEILLYDFSLEKGDSIDCFGVFIHVDSVYYHEFGNLPEKLKHIGFKQYGYKTGTWIEGIGSIRGVLEGTLGLPLSTGGTSTLVCYLKNDEIIYHNPNFSQCFITGTAVKSYQNKKQLIDVFNISQGTIQVNNFDAMQGIIDLFTINGTKIFSQEITLNETQLCLPQSGVFIYQFTNKKGEIQTGKVTMK